MMSMPKDDCQCCWKFGVGNTGGIFNASVIAANVLIVLRKLVTTTSVKDTGQAYVGCCIHDTVGHFAADIKETSGAPWVANIFENVLKISFAKEIIEGPGEDDSRTKFWSKKSRHCPFKECIVCFVIVKYKKHVRVGSQCHLQLH